MVEGHVAAVWEPCARFHLALTVSPPGPDGAAGRGAGRGGRRGEGGNRGTFSAAAIPEFLAETK